MLVTQGMHVNVTIESSIVSLDRYKMANIITQLNVCISFNIFQLLYNGLFTLPEMAIKFGIRVRVRSRVRLRQCK